MRHPAAQDLEVIRRRLCAWLMTKRAGAGGVRIDNLSAPAEGGASNDTVLFDAAWAESADTCGERLVLRCTPSGYTLFPTYDLALQCRVMQALADTDVPVPGVRWFEPDERPFGGPFYVMDRIDGRIPPDNPPYHMTGWITALRPQERARLWWNGLETMMRVHRLDWRALGFEFLDEPHRGATPLEQQLQYYDEYLAWAVDARRYPLLEVTRRWLHANRPAEEPVALCWGDSRLANQVFDAGLNCVALLDWEMARLGDPVQDLAWWLTADRCFSEGLDVERLPGFPDRAATITRWEAGVGRSARSLPYYEVLALHRFSIMMARKGEQMRHYGTYPSDDDMFVYRLGAGTLARVFAEVTGGSATAVEERHAPS